MGIIIPVIAIVEISYIKRQSKKELIKKYQTIDSLLERYKGKETDFEHYIAHLYELLGYKVKVTSPTNDRGKDIIMWKNGIKYVVEVKLYSEKNPVDRPKIQKLHSAMIDCNASEAIFVTTSRFTEPAKEYADKFGIETINGSQLAELIGKQMNKFHC